MAGEFPDPGSLDREYVGAGDAGSAESQFPVRNPAVVYTTIGENAVLVSPKDSLHYWLNPVASRIWELATGSHTTREISQQLCGEFAVGFQAALSDTTNAVLALVANGLLLVGDAEHAADDTTNVWGLRCRSDGVRGAHAAAEGRLSIGAGPTGDVSARIWRLAEERCIPLGATLEVTLGCNLRCVHCYNFDRGSSRPYPERRQRTELTPTEIVDAIDQLAAAGCLYLCLTGGEALLHPDLHRFISHARWRRKLAVKVKSNGALLTARRVEELVRAGTLGVDISIYGATCRTHDAFTRKPGSFEKTVDGIRNAQEGGLDVKVNMSLVRSNAFEIPMMIEFVEGLGLPYSVDPFITARHDGTRDSISEQVDALTLRALYTGPLRHLVRPPDFDPERSVQCACARATCGVSATGDVYPCIGAPIRAGNLREQSFSEIWSSSPVLNGIRALRLRDFKACQPCRDRAFCRRNSGVAFTNTGEYTGPEAFTCMEAATVRSLHGGEAATRSA